MDYVPGFDVEPRLLAALGQVLATVAPDLRATGLEGNARLVVLEGSEPPRAHVRYRGRPAGHSSGLAPGDAAGPPGSPETVMLVAGEHLVEEHATQQARRPDPRGQ